MRLKNIVRLLNKAIEKETEDLIWQIWLTKYPHMTNETFISFKDFKDQLFEKKYSDKTYEEIEEEMEKVVRVYEERQVK